MVPQMKFLYIDCAGSAQIKGQQMQNEVDMLGQRNIHMHNVIYLISFSWVDYRTTSTLCF